MMGQRLLETTSPLLHLLCIVTPFLFLRWNGFSLNMLWPIINYHLLLPRLHLMSCDYLLAVARPPSQLLPLLCSPLLVVVCPFLLFLGWTGCSFRDYSMRQRFFQVA